MLRLLSNTNIGNEGGSIVFEAVGGTGPYVYSLGTGIGGTIDSSGIYTVPYDVGNQEIIVTDSLLETVTRTISVLNPIQTICHIIKTFMELDDDQVYIYNQKVMVPKDYKLYVAVGISSIKPFASKSVFDGTNEVSTTNVQASISINIMSRGPDALNKKEMVIMSLNSMFSRNIQAAQGFKIAKLPTGFNDLSNIDGSAIPFRFNISVNVLYSIKRVKSADYYGTFQGVDITTEK